MRKRPRAARRALFCVVGRRNAAAALRLGGFHAFGAVRGSKSKRERELARGLERVFSTLRTQRVCRSAGYAHRNRDQHMKESRLFCR